jgi:hypothetical protein
MWDKPARCLGRRSTVHAVNSGSNKGGEQVPVNCRKYRVIIDDGLGGLEQQMNELAQPGFRAILMSMTEDTVIAVTMERSEE